MQRNVSIFVSVLFLLIVQPVFAENNTGKFGQTNDGRAYRVNKDGYKIFDQLAELEVENDSLRRQVAGLEMALEKARTLPSQTIEETSIVKSSGVTNPGSKNVNIKQCAAVDCSEQILPLKKRISILELEKRQFKFKRSKLNESQGAALKAMRAKLASLNAQLKDRELEFKNLNRKVEAIKGREQDNLLKELQVARKDSQQLETQNAELEKRLASLSEEVKSLKAKDLEVSKLKARLESKRRSRLAYNTNNETRRNISADSSRVNVNSQLRKAVYSELRRKLVKIDHLLSERKQLGDSLRSQRKGIAISLRPLLTKRGVSLDSLRRGVKRKEFLNHAAALKAGLAEIKKILEDDIKVIRRMRSVS